MESGSSVHYGEEDELQRSTKQVKDSASEYSHEGNEEALPTQIKSSRNKLLAVTLGAYAHIGTIDNHLEREEELNDEVSDLAKGFVAVKLSKETKNRIRRGWNNALIVKVFRQTMELQFLYKRVMNLWKPQCRVDYIDLGKGFFLFRFEEKMDMDRVISKGP